MRVRGLVFGVWLVPASAAAHTPGLSQGTYRVDGRRVAVEVVLARGEAGELVARIDGDRDGVVSEIELLMAQDALAAALTAGVEVVDGDARCPGETSRVAFVEEDGLAFSSQYTCPEGQPLAALTVRLPMVGKLAGGHRHLGQVRFVGASAGEVDRAVDFVAQRRRPALTIRRPDVPAEAPPSPAAPSAARVEDGVEAAAPVEVVPAAAAPRVAAPRWRVFAGLAALFGLAGLVAHRLRGRRRGA